MKSHLDATVRGMGLLAAALLLAACSSGASKGPEGPAVGSTVQSSAAAGPIAIKETEFAIGPANVTSTGGIVTFQVTNAGAIEHDFTIRDKAGTTVGQIPILAVSESKPLRVTLAAGTYQMICTLPGHATAGMMGEITVSP